MISYDSDIKSILNFFYTLKIKNKKLIIFSNVFKSTSKEIIIKPKIYKYNFSYLNYATFFITETRFADNYYALNLAFRKGLICVIPDYYRELKNKTITFKENLSEVKTNLENCITNPKKMNIYKNISKSHIKSLESINIESILFS